MTDQPTDKLPEPSIEQRLASIELLLLKLTTDITEIKKQQIESQKHQAEMYVDLRQRLKLVHDKVDVVQREVEEYIRDAQPDSLQSRLIN